MRPRDRPRSSQRPHRYRCRTCACAPRRVRKDTAAKRPKRFRQSRARAAARHNRAWPAAAAQAAKSPLSLVDDQPASACDHGSDHTDRCQRAEEVPTLLPAAKLLQPPYAAKAAKPCRRARMRGCQLQQQSRGGFEIKEMLTRGDPKVGGGRRTYSARHLVELVGSTRPSAQIY